MDHVLAWTIRMIFWNLCSSYKNVVWTIRMIHWKKCSSNPLKSSQFKKTKNRKNHFKKSNETRISFWSKTYSNAMLSNLFKRSTETYLNLKPNRTPFSSANYVYFTNFSWTHSCEPNNITTMPRWPRNIVNWKKRFHNKGTTMHLLSVLPFTRLLSQPKMEYAHMDHARSTQRIKKFNEQDKWKSKKQIKQTPVSVNLCLEPPDDYQLLFGGFLFSMTK